jgi:hypothetical protein
MWLIWKIWCRNMWSRLMPESTYGNGIHVLLYRMWMARLQSEYGSWCWLFCNSEDDIYLLGYLLSQCRSTVGDLSKFCGCSIPWYYWTTQGIRPSHACWRSCSIFGYFDFVHFLPTIFSLVCWKLKNAMLWLCSRSDVLGQVMPLMGRDWTQSGVTRLFSAIKVLSCVRTLVFRSIKVSWYVKKIMVIIALYMLAGHFFICDFNWSLIRYFRALSYSKIILCISYFNRVNLYLNVAHFYFASNISMEQGIRSSFLTSVAWIMLLLKSWLYHGAYQENGYEVMFLSARAISQAYLTRQFLLNLKQVSMCF